ncbi:MAG: hypothetical protein IJX77_09305 [Ruminococcus sp.]|nr:hypothetical protein [Ruminococcus sp.]
MEFLIEVLIEIVFELVFESAEYVAVSDLANKNKKGKKRVLAIIVAVIFLLIYTAVVLLMIFIGISALKENILFSIFAFALAVFFIYGLIFKIRKVRTKMKNRIKNNPES